ncbi:unnamed protein product [Phytomonas sp. Hart1]|nr:unnamed protein product [Phytomonas sp. Hart1]|eukprot:CCW71094.1 unnamed protein product [Phytomonas sp. isolate Hart1]
MGVKGLWKYIEQHGVVYDAPKEMGGQGSSWVLRPNHLFIDMNCILHIAFEKTHGSTTRRVLQGIRRLVLAILRQVRPSSTLGVVFDGIAPLAKIPTQKERRASLSPHPPSRSPASSDGLFSCDLLNAEVPLRKPEIGSGSQFVYACEEFLEAMLREMELAHDALATWTTRRMSRSLEPGEGELKISRLIRQVWQDDARKGVYRPEDDVVLVGNDSDLILVALVATPYRELTILHPDTFARTCLGVLFEQWRKDLPNPPLPLDLLPSYRVDFVFIRLLAGGDYHDGLRQHVEELWRNYRNLRANSGFFRRPLLRGEDLSLDVEFLRRIVGVGKRKEDRWNGGGSKTKGRQLLRAALWGLKGLIFGRCVDYAFESPDLGRGGVSVADLRAAALSRGIGRAIGTDSPVSAISTPPADSTSSDHPESPTSLTTMELEDPDRPAQARLTVLEQYIAVMGVRGRYSKELDRAIDQSTDDHGKKFTMSKSTSFLVGMVKKIMANVDINRLSKAERALYNPLTCQDEPTADEGALLRL